jgi:hypothetical protein
VAIWRSTAVARALAMAWAWFWQQLAAWAKAEAVADASASATAVAARTQEGKGVGGRGWGERRVGWGIGVFSCVRWGDVLRACSFRCGGELGSMERAPRALQGSAAQPWSRQLPTRAAHRYRWRWRSRCTLGMTGPRRRLRHRPERWPARAQGPAKSCVAECLGRAFSMENRLSPLPPSRLAAPPSAVPTVAVACAAALAWAVASPPPHALATAEAMASLTAVACWLKPLAEEEAREEQAAGGRKERKEKGRSRSAAATGRRVDAAAAHQGQAASLAPGAGQKGSQAREACAAAAFPPSLTYPPPHPSPQLTSHPLVDCVGDSARVALLQGVGVHGLAGGGTDGGGHSLRWARIRVYVCVCVCVWWGEDAMRCATHNRFGATLQPESAITC